MDKSVIGQEVHEGRFRMIIENTQDLIVTTDLKGNFTYISPSLGRMLGFKYEELIGKNVLSLIHPDDKKGARERFDKTLAGEAHGAEAVRVKHKNGTWLYLEANGQTVFPEVNNPFMFVSIMRDVTSRVESERKKDEFVNILSHELRTPMTSIGLFSSILEKGLQSERNSLYKYLVKLKEQVERLSRHIQAFIDVSEIQVGSLHLKKEEFSLNDLIRQLISYYKDKVKYEIILSENDKSIILHADKKRLEEVVNVLLSNAIKYSASDQLIHIGLSKKDRNAEVAIRDYGIGIPEEEQKRIFEKFYQVGDQSKYLNPGFGVGLYFAREIVEMHKGQVWMESEKGKGSIFYFSLPLINK